MVIKLKYVLCFILILWIYPLLSQGNINKDASGVYTGTLYFSTNSKITGNGTSIRLLTGDQKDSYLSPYRWFKNGTSRVSGVIGDACLVLQWSEILGDPIEKYAFKWTNSGYFKVEYEDEGVEKSFSLTRDDLKKYPDLLKQYDNIAPNNISFEIGFRSSNIDDQEYNDFRRANNILGTLGSEGLSESYTRQVPGVQLYFDISGKDPYIFPIAEMGYPQFLGLKQTDSKARLKVAVFRMGRTLVINNYKISSIDWPVETYVNIAKRYEGYEKGELSPLDSVKFAKTKPNANTADDFWDNVDLPNPETETFQSNGKLGLRLKNGRVILPATAWSIEKNKVAVASESSSKDFWVVDGNKLYTNDGKFFADISGYEIDNKLLRKRTSPSEFNIDCKCFAYEIRTALYDFSILSTDGTIKSTGKKTYSTGLEQRPIYLTVRSSNDEPADVIERQKKECIDNCQNKANSIENQIKSLGYTK